jgi:hypothetical protein
METLNNLGARQDFTDDTFDETYNLIAKEGTGKMDKNTMVNFIK